MLFYSIKKPPSWRFFEIDLLATPVLNRDFKEDLDGFGRVPFRRLGRGPLTELLPD